VIRHLMPCLTVAGILLMAGIVVDSLRCRRQEGKEARGPSSVLLPSPRPHRASPGWAGLGAWCAGRQSVSHVVWAPPRPATLRAGCRAHPSPLRTGWRYRCWSAVCVRLAGPPSYPVASLMGVR
jgi:hypothetical protein